MPVKTKLASLDPTYGLKADATPLEWTTVRARLEAAETYWISTVTPSNTPWPRPVDGNWLDEAFYFSGSTQSRWFKNLGHNPSAVLHLEEGKDPVMVHGEIIKGALDGALVDTLIERTQDKYGYAMPREMFASENMLTFRPRFCLSWSLLYEDATRFDFE